MPFRVRDTLVPGAKEDQEGKIFPVVDAKYVSLNEDETQYLNTYLENLNATINALTERIVALENGTVTLDTKKIDNLIYQANSLNKEDYTTSSWESLDIAYNAALDARKNATTQSELDEAALALEQAIDNLETLSTEVDKTVLETTIREAEQTIEGEDKADYTSDSWTNLENALEDAQTVFDQTSSTQAEVDNATQALRDAIDALEKAPEITVDKTALANVISEVDKLDETNYSEPSWAALEAAKITANAVYADSTATQAQVNDAEAALKTAKANLLDISGLNAAIQRAQGYNEADYTSESWEYLQTALGNAQSVLNSANAAIEGETQTSVNDAVVNLNNACDALVPKTESQIEFVINASGQGENREYSVVAETTWQAWYNTDAPDSYNIDSENRIIPAGGWHLEDSLGNTIYASEVIAAGTYYWKADNSQEEPTGIVDTIIANEMPMYSISTTGELVETPFKLIDGDAAPTESGFYTITDDQGNVIEAGYQDLQVENDKVYYVIALPKEVDYNTMVEVESYDPDEKIWVDADIALTSDPNVVSVLCEEARIDITHIDTNKYTVWVQEDICTGSIIRYRIIEEN